MDAQTAWRYWQEEYHALGIRVAPLEAPAALETLCAEVGMVAPAPVEAFARLWGAADDAQSRWASLVLSAAIVQPSIAEELMGSVLLAPLQRWVERAEYAAITYGHRAKRRAPDPWGYLLYRPSKNGQDLPTFLRFHLPAIEDDFAQSELAPGVGIPLDYKRLLMLTNGLELDPLESRFICGVGPSRIDWRPLFYKPMLLDEWKWVDGSHELITLARGFQSLYENERIMDRERGEDTFRSDPTQYIPFAYTYDYWCFSVPTDHTDGRRPVYFWDHELREASEVAPDFATWFASSDALGGDELP